MGSFCNFLFGADADASGVDLIPRADDGCGSTSGSGSGCGAGLEGGVVETGAAVAEFAAAGADVRGTASGFACCSFPGGCSPVGSFCNLIEKSAGDGGLHTGGSGRG